MRCFVYKMWLSSSLDADKPVPERVKRHARRCESCRMHLRWMLALHHRLTQETPAALSIRLKAFTVGR